MKMVGSFPQWHGVCGTCLCGFGILAALVGLLSFAVTPALADFTGSLHRARWGHTATLLPDGRVLVTGGDAVDLERGMRIRLESAEIYDPLSGQWTQTGSLQDARSSHMAVLLSSGHVLVVGGGAESGIDFDAVSRRTEVFDPVTGQWAHSGSLNVIRNSSPAATLLPDGRVLVVGGVFVAGEVERAELYDPASGQWTKSGKVEDSRVGQTVTLLADGKVLMVGGTHVALFSGGLSSAEIYDPANGQWTPTGSLQEGRYGHTATLLPDGKVIVVGGQQSVLDDGGLSSAELYDTDSGQWTRTSENLSEGRQLHTATLLLDGNVFVASSRQGVASAELYESASGLWKEIDCLCEARSGHSAALLHDGKVLLAGGSASGADKFTPLASAELCDPVNGREESDLQALRVVQVAIDGTDVVIQFTSLPGRSYVLQRTGNLDGEVWTNVSTSEASAMITKATDQVDPESYPRGAYYRVVELLP